MSNPSDWTPFGPFLLKQQTLVKKETRAIEADVAFVLAGWEERAIAFKDFCTFSTKNLKLFDFKAPDKSADLVHAQKFILNQIYPSIENIALRLSTDVDINLNTIRERLNKLSRSGVSSLFLDVTCMPKTYVQSIIGFIFTETLFGRVTIGYAEGTYAGMGRETSLEPASVSFESAKPMIGGGGPVREKRLHVVLGAERANCYALIEKMAPDYIHLLATTSARHPRLREAVDLQINKIMSEYGDKVVETRDVEAFSILDFTSAFSIKETKLNQDIANTIYVGATKPLAVAAAIVACATGNMDLRYRKVREYPISKVGKSAYYHLFDIVDLRSERLINCGVW